MSDRQTAILEAAVRVIAASGVRGLRVETLAAEAAISTALIYYHFGNRAGLIRRTLEYVNDRAAGYTEQALASGDPRATIEQMLLLELQDTTTVRENSTAWGELRACAVFDEDLRSPLRDATQAWSAELEKAIKAAQDSEKADPSINSGDVAERLTALVEGLSERWLSGSITLERARQLLAGAITAELG